MASRDGAAGPVTIDLTECTDQEEEDGEEQPPDVLTTIDGNQITKRHRDILLCDYEWLNDEIVNSFCARISQRVPDIHCCSSFFFTKLSSAGRDFAWLERWRDSNSVMQRRLIFIPVNWGNSHWALLVYSVREGTLRYYDSMMSLSKSREALGRVRRAFEAIRLIHHPPSPSPSAPRSKEGEPVGVLAFIMSKMSLSPPPPPSADETIVIKTETPRGQPQQTDGSSCGVYLCWWVEQLARPEDSITGRLSSMIAYREHILETLLDQR